MSLSKRPKGEEIEARIREAIYQHSNFNDDHGLQKLRRDLELLVEYLKLEFRDTPATPSKRVIGKARKKTKKAGPSPNEPFAAMKQMGYPSYGAYVNNGHPYYTMKVTTTD